MKKKKIPPNVIDAQHKFPKKRFEMPNDFPENAIAHWKSCEPYAWKTGLLNEETLPDFIDMCRSYDEYVQIAIRIQEEGSVLKSASGNLKQNPLNKQHGKLSNKLIRYYKKFGLTPLSRSKKGLPSTGDLGLE